MPPTGTASRSSRPTSTATAARSCSPPARRAAPTTTRNGCCARPGRSLDRLGALPLRIGVNCGPVFAGDFGPPFRRTYSVKGDAINLAARVHGQGAAGPAARHRRRSRRARPASSTSNRLPPFHGQGKVGSRRRGQRRDPAGVSARRPGTRHRPLVGRADELATLLAALDACPLRPRIRGGAVRRAGDRQVPAGPGAAAHDGPRRVRQRRCDEYETATAYWPFRTLLREVLRVPAGEGPDAAADELRTAAERLHPRRAAVAAPRRAASLDADLPSTTEVDAARRRVPQGPPGAGHDRAAAAVAAPSPPCSCSTTRT